MTNWLGRHQLRAIWAGVITLLLLDLVLTIAIAKTRVHSVDSLLVEGQAAILGLQTLATIILAGLTAHYVLLTRSLLVETQAAQERAREAAARNDLDETRRLAYVALLANKTGHVDLAASLVNALVHHQGVDLEEALANVPTVLNGGDGDYDAARWIREQIRRITAELESEHPAAIDRGSAACGAP